MTTTGDMLLIEYRGLRVLAPIVIVLQRAFIWSI